MEKTLSNRIENTLNKRLPWLIQRCSIGPWPQSKKFSGDLAWTTSASIAVKFQGFILIILLGRMVGVEWYGAWTLTFAVTSYLTVITTMMLPNAMVRFFPGESETFTPTIFLFLFSIVATLSFGTAFLVLPFANQFAILFLNSTVYNEFVMWGVLLIPMNALLNMQQDYYRAHDDLKSFSLISGGTPILQLITVGITLFVIPDALRALQLFIFVGFAIESIIAVSIFKQVNWRRIYSRANWERLKRYLKYSLPLVPSGFSSQISSNGDRFVVGYFLGAQYVGIYSVAYSLASILMLFNPPITNVLFPKISKFYVTRNYAAIRKYINVGMTLFGVIGGLITLGLLIFGSYLLGFLIKESSQVPNFSHLFGVTLIVSFALIVYGISRIYSLYILIYEKTMAWFAIYLSSAMLNLALNFMLIPAYGLLGAAFSTLLSYALIAIIIFWYVSKRDILDLRRARHVEPSKMDAPY